MVNGLDVVIVTAIAIGTVVLLGLLGYLIEKSNDDVAEPAERKRARNGAKTVNFGAER